MNTENNLSFQNEWTREILYQIQAFEKELPEDKQVAIVFNGSVIIIERVIRLFEFGRIVLCGLCTIAAPPLIVGERVRLLLEPTFPNLTLTSVQRKDSTSRKPIGFLNQGQESEQD